VKVLLVEGHGTENIHAVVSEFADVVSESESPKVVLAVGGDNTMLRAIHDYRKLRIPFIGLNKGTVGFLMNDLTEKNEFPSSKSDFNKMVKKSESMNLWMLEAEITYKDHKISNLVHGFNDIYFKSRDGQALKMKLTVDDVEVPEVVVGDGFIVSTPQGSTGYNRAASGKIIRPGSPIIQLTPMACTIGERRSILDSFIEPDNTVFKIEFQQCKYRQPQIMFDGVKLPCSKLVETITIKKSRKEVELLFSRDFNFYEKIYRLKFQQGW